MLILFLTQLAGKNIGSCQTMACRLKPNGELGSATQTNVPSKQCACAHKPSDERTKITLSAQKCSFQKSFCSLHIPYMSFEIQMSPIKMLHKGNLCAHIL